MLETIFYFSLLGVAIYKVGNFFMSFLIAVRAHYWG